MDSSDHGTKSDPNGTFELCPKNKKFSPKINQDRVANNDFDLQNDSGLWRENKIGSF
jgi:hypothetical protein